MRKIRNDKAKAFKCPKCNISHVQCVQLFGQWPTPEFKELDDADQEAFWREEGIKKADLEEIVARDVLRKLIQMRAGANEG